MKKISLVILFWMGLFSIARAEWVLYGDNGKAAFYYDPSTVLVCKIIELLFGKCWTTVSR